MQALWLENNQLTLRNLPQPLKPAEALVRIRLAGICGTDLELVKGYYPFSGIPGHEFVGEVVAVHPQQTGQPGPGAEKMIGKRVVGEKSCRDLFYGS